MVDVVPPDIHELLERAAERTTRWQYFAWYWGDAIAVDGLLEANTVGVSSARADVVASLRRWLANCPENFDDVLAPGRAIVDLVVAGDLSTSAVDRFIGAVDRLPLLDGVIPALEPHRPTWRFGVCIDAIYHLPVALAAAALWREDEVLLRRSLLMAERTVELLECPTGWAQWYDDTVGANNGIAWSRGIGWALLGLLDLLQMVDDESLAGSLPAVVRRMFDRLAETQGPNGQWRSVLNDDEAAYEASTSAFFVACALHPAAIARYPVPSHVLDRAKSAVIASVDPEGIAQGVSTDILPGWDITPYRVFDIAPSPWGQGAALRALVALRRSSESRR